MTMNRNYDAPVKARILAPDGSEAPFVVSLFGVPYRDLMVTPGGGWPVRVGLGARLVADGYSSSLFLVEETTR